MSYVAGDKAEILKVRIGNGNSAVDVEWQDKDLCWLVSSRAFSGWWFPVGTEGTEGTDGYNEALRLAGELEALIQRWCRYKDEADGVEREIRTMVHARKSPPVEPVPVPDPER